MSCIKRIAFAKVTSIFALCWDGNCAWKPNRIRGPNYSAVEMGGDNNVDNKGGCNSDDDDNSREEEWQ